MRKQYRNSLTIPFSSTLNNKEVNKQNTLFLNRPIIQQNKEKKDACAHYQLFGTSSSPMRLISINANEQPRKQKPFSALSRLLKIRTISTFFFLLSFRDGGSYFFLLLFYLLNLFSICFVCGVVWCLFYDHQFSCTAPFGALYCGKTTVLFSYFFREKNYCAFCFYYLRTKNVTT